MSISTAKLLWLTLLAVIRNGEPDCTSGNISCPCGASNSTVQLSDRLSCKESTIKEDPCIIFQNCETCKNGLDHCLTCPKGKFGSFCNKDRNVNDGVRQEGLIRKIRQIAQCPELRSPRPGSIRCTYDNEKASCTGTCSPGHTFQDGETEMIFECNYYRREWTPLPSFPPCVSLGLCDFELEGAGFYNCTTNDRGTFCDIRCLGSPPVSGRYFCFPGQEWDPRLPYCAKKKALNDGSNRCKCANGGTCGSSESKCTCPQDYEGDKCEKWIECGHTPSLAKRRVTFGEETIPGEFPWQVGLATNPTGSGWNIVCGGVLITRDAVLTAAHCLSSTREADYRLYLGRYFLLVDDEDDEVEERTPSRLLIHPLYNIEAPLDADVAVVRFTPPVSFTARILPICLTDIEKSHKNLIPSTPGWVTGWGLTENQVQSESLLKAEVPVVSSSDCRQSYAQKRINIQLTDNMYCAGHEEGRTDACEGDSGGPMIFRPNGTRSFVLEGLISFGSPEGCGQPKHYSVYTKVRNYLTWIKENI